MTNLHEANTPIVQRTSERSTTDQPYQLVFVFDHDGRHVDVTLDLRNDDLRKFLTSSPALLSHPLYALEPGPHKAYVTGSDLLRGLSRVGAFKGHSQGNVADAIAKNFRNLFVGHL